MISLSEQCRDALLSYVNNRKAPIGPWKWVVPKGETSYSEIWNLLPNQYPKSKEEDEKNINDKVIVLN